MDSANYGMRELPLRSPSHATAVSGMWNAGRDENRIDRVMRRFFAMASVLSLLVCAGICAMWIRSFWVNDHIIWAHRGYSSSHLIESLRGNVAVEHDANSIPDSGGGWWAYPVYPPATPDEWSYIDRPQFRMPLYFADSHIQASLIVCPDWIVAISAALLPAIAAVKWRMHRSRAVAGVCLACGYDLRATPERCPECGKTPANMM